MTTTTIFTPDPPVAEKQGIVGPLDAVEAMIREYVQHLVPRDRLTVQLTFSAFLIYVRRKMEMEAKEATNGEDTR